MAGTRVRYPGFGNAALKYQANMQNLKSKASSSSLLSLFGGGGDLQGSSSDSYGSYGGGYGVDPGSCFSLDICPDLILAAIALAAAVAAFVLYQTITMAGKRRKREADQSGNLVTDLLWLGRIHLWHFCLTVMSFIGKSINSCINVSAYVCMT